MTKLYFLLTVGLCFLSASLLSAQTFRLPDNLERVTVENATRFKKVMTLPGHGEFVEHVAFSPDGKVVATSSSQRTLRLWDLETFEETLALSYEHRINNFTFSPDSATLAVASFSALDLLDAYTGKTISELHGDTSHIFDVDFSPDGKLLAAVSPREDPARLCVRRQRKWDRRRV